MMRVYVGTGWWFLSMVSVYLHALPCVHGRWALFNGLCGSASEPKQRCFRCVDEGE